MVAVRLRTESDLTVLGQELMKAYLDQVFVHGMIHADPHPGNVFVVFPEHHNPLTPSEARATDRRADQVTEHQLPDPIGRIWLYLVDPLGFRLLQPVEPLIERFEPCVWWKSWVLPGLVRRHDLSLCVAPP